MENGEVKGTANPTGDSLLLDCRFELPWGAYCYTLTLLSSQSVDVGSESLTFVSVCLCLFVCFCKCLYFTFLSSNFYISKDVLYLFKFL